MTKFVTTFEIADADTTTGVAVEDTGFSWAKTLSEPDTPAIALEPSPLPSNARLLDDVADGAIEPSESERGHKERFTQMLDAAVKSPKSSG